MRPSYCDGLKSRFWVKDDAGRNGTRDSGRLSGRYEDGKSEGPGRRTRCDCSHDGRVPLLLFCRPGWVRVAIPGNGNPDVKFSTSNKLTQSEAATESRASRCHRTMGTTVQSG